MRRRPSSWLSSLLAWILILGLGGLTAASFRRSATPPAASVAAKPATVLVPPVTAPSSRVGHAVMHSRKPTRPPQPDPTPTQSGTAELRLALATQAAALQQCAAPFEAPRRILTTLRLARDGRVRNVSFERESSLPADWANCLRLRILKWRLPALHLSQPLEVFLALAVEPNETAVTEAGRQESTHD